MSNVVLDDSRMPPFHMSTQTIKDTNGHVVFLKKLHWFKTESQVEAYVDRIIRPRQVEYYWPEKDETAKKAKQQNVGYAWIVACLFRNEQPAPHASKQHALSFNSFSSCVGLSSHVRRPGM
ncbi:hypothetical protein K4K57_002143 [Colletotrichum sp. SAR 10_99]|nr:hypothetical protein K4K55_001722 [Colletotrichum sp. SAR 10_96]KAJ5013946.1 hypothetical protein K4K57_002143 [Colletotrichum sp. SAR 10_99]